MENPFEITVYDRDFVFVGFVVNPTFAHFVPAWQSQGYGSFMLAADNPHSAALQAKGARVVVQYKGEHLMSGPVRSRRGDLIANGTVTYQILDDRRILVNTLAWIRPRNPLMPASLSALGQAYLKPGKAQTTGSVVHQTPYFQWPTMTSSEQAIKHLVTENVVVRLGRPVTVMPNLGRGPNPTAILPRPRMEPLKEVIKPILTFSGLGVTMYQTVGTTGIKFDVREPGEWVQILTPEAGIVRDGVYAIGAPDITRPIVGGPGETSGRSWDGIVGLGNVTADEIAYNDVIEIYREANGDELAWPEGLADALKVPKYYPFRAEADDLAAFYQMFADARAEALLEGAGKSGLWMELSETDTFHFGGADGIQLGDIVTIKASGQTFTNQVSEAMLTFTRDDGLKVTPMIGQREDDPDVVLANTLARVSKAIRTLSTRK